MRMIRCFPAGVSLSVFLAVLAAAFLTPAEAVASTGPVINCYQTCDCTITNSTCVSTDGTVGCSTACGCHFGFLGYWCGNL